ncbi:hypothetical protein Glove_382g74 [Diversispora epigaea]|uniref:Uncharacterized protein n=1 Tax=Diversispora epigaea TaxID=1348612 RepID=A0A397H8W0_9GLOM|nr:hypothetical protein Glove_382g74 [Diversispora epigaea]
MIISTHRWQECCHKRGNNQRSGDKPKAFAAILDPTGCISQELATNKMQDGMNNGVGHF